MHQNVQLRRHLFSIFNQNGRLSTQFSDTPILSFIEKILIVVLEALHACGWADKRAGRYWELLGEFLQRFVKNKSFVVKVRYRVCDWWKDNHWQLSRNFCFNNASGLSTQRIMQKTVSTLEH
jgi:hypothetical protein